MKKTLPLSYKGNRDYLHGSDIFNALSDMSAELAGVADAYVERLAFRRFARLACEVCTEAPADPTQLVSQARVHRPGQNSLDLWLTETSEPVTSRRPFDEAQLLAGASVDAEQRSATLGQGSMYTPIEEVIALTKHLSYAIAPEVSGKWVFGQLDLAQPLTGNYQTLEIRMKTLVGGRFSVNDILFDGHSIGSIRFIGASQ